MTPHAIEAQGLTVRYDDEPVVDSLDLAVPEGCIFGLVGKNGAGKTTTLRLLLGMLEPDAGRSTIYGEDSLELSKSTRQRIGYLSENDFPYRGLIFADILRFLSGFFDDWDWSWCEHLIERLQVKKSRPLHQMSKGERRIAELLLAVAHKPDLLLLDDPAVGLDATVRREVLWTLLETVCENGSTVVFSSHILQDVERIVDHVGILHRGRLRMAGALDDIKGRMRRIVLPAAAAPDEVEGEILRERRGGEVVVITERYAPELDGRWGEVDSAPMNLEDIFLAVAANGGS